MVKKFWQDKTVFVTGGHGFLGKHLIYHLDRLGCKRIIAPRHDEVNLLYSEQAEAALFASRPKIDFLFHLAADVGGIGYNQENPYELFYNNAMMGIKLIDHCVLTEKVGKFIMAGTTCSYPKACHTPFHESNFWNGYPEETNAPYGIAKRMLLGQLQAANRQYGFNFAYVVLANLYGPGDNFGDEKSHVIPALIKRFHEERNSKEITIWGSGKPTRDFLYVTDAARALTTAAEKYNDTSPINFGSGTEISIETLVSIIKRLMGNRAEIKWDTSKPDGQPARVLNISKARSLGWTPTLTLPQGLYNTIKWYREHGEYRT